MTIQELADAVGVTRRTIRYYVSEGLLPPPLGRGRKQGYDEDHLARLKLILKLKQEYLPLQKIREKLKALPAGQFEFMTTDSVREDPSEYRLEMTVRSEEPEQYYCDNEPVNKPSQQDLFGYSEDWERMLLGPGIELSYRKSNDRAKYEAVQKILTYSMKVLSEPSGPFAKREAKSKKPKRGKKGRK